MQIPDSSNKKVKDGSRKTKYFEFIDWTFNWAL